MKKGILAFIGMILALVLIIVALIGPWYSISLTTMGQDGSVDMTLSQMTVKIMGMEQTMNYNKVAETSSATTGMPVDTDSLDVFTNTMYITLVALIVGILTVALLALQVFANKQNMKKLAMIFGIVTFAMAIIAIIYFMTNSITGGEYGFWFSESINQMGMNMDMSGGPGFSWYLMLVAGIISLISSIMLLLDKEEKIPTMQQPKME